MKEDEDKLQSDLNNIAAVIGEKSDNYIVFMGNDKSWCFRTNNGLWAEFVCRRYILEKEESFKQGLNDE